MVDLCSKLISWCFPRWWSQGGKISHTLIFSHEIVEKKDKVIADKWGIICSRNEAVNHRGELVLRFFVEILAERDPAKLAR